jgi:hypothetical protein
MPPQWLHKHDLSQISEEHGNAPYAWHSKEVGPYIQQAKPISLSDHRLFAGHRPFPAQRQQLPGQQQMRLSTGLRRPCSQLLLILQQHLTLWSFVGKLVFGRGSAAAAAAGHGSLPKTSWDTGEREEKRGARSPALEDEGSATVDALGGVSKREAGNRVARDFQEKSCAARDHQLDRT